MAGAISHHALAFSQSHWCSAKNSRFGKRTGNARLVYLKGRCGSGSKKLGLMWASSSQSSVMEPTHLPSDGNSGHTPKKSSNFNDLLWWLFVFNLRNCPFDTFNFGLLRIWGHIIRSANLLSLCRCRWKRSYIDSAWWIPVEREKSVYWLRRCTPDTEGCWGGHWGR